MLETASKIANSQLTVKLWRHILAEGKQMFTQPIVVYEHVIETLQQLGRRKTLDADHTRRIVRTREPYSAFGFGEFFTYIEIVKTKSIDVYRQVWINITYQQIVL
jgi:hypothetical protein